MRPRRRALSAGGALLLLLASFGACTGAADDGPSPTTPAGAGGSAGAAQAGGGSIANTGPSGAGGAGGQQAGGGGASTNPLGGFGLSSGAAGKPGAAGAAGAAVLPDQTHWEPLAKTYPTNAKISVLKNIESSPKIFTWEPCEPSLTGCEVLRFVPGVSWLPDETLMLPLPQVWFDGTTTWVVFVARSRCSYSGAPGLTEYTLVVAKEDGTAVVAMRIPDDNGCGFLHPALSGGRVETTAACLSPPNEHGFSESEYSFLGANLADPGKLVVGTHLYRSVDDGEPFERAVFLGERSVRTMASGDLLSLHALDGDDPQTLMVQAPPLTHALNEPAPFGKEHFVLSQGGLDGTIWVGDATSPPRLFMKGNPPGELYKHPYDVGGEFAWLHMTDLVEYRFGNIELWASPLDPDPAKMKPRLVGKVPGANFFPDGPVLGGHGHYALMLATDDVDRRNWVRVHGLAAGEVRQVEVSASVSSFPGISPTHLYLGSGRCLDGLWRLRVDAIPTVTE